MYQLFNVQALLLIMVKSIKQMTNYGENLSFFNGIDRKLIFFVFYFFFVYDKIITIIIIITYKKKTTDQIIIFFFIFMCNITFNYVFIN